MHRSELAAKLGGIIVQGCTVEEVAEDAAIIDAAAAELAKSCSGCRHFDRGSTKRPEWTVPMTWVTCRDRRLSVYQFEDDALLPADGSGFCHRWECGGALVEAHP